MPNWPHGSKLDLGAGFNKLDGYTGIDIVKSDIVYDLTQIPYPTNDNSVDRLFCRHTLEHFDWATVIKIMNECYRILMPEHEMEIIVPLFPADSAIDDPAHHTYFGKETFGRFEPENKYAYEMEVINKWRRLKNNWTPEIEVTETSQGLQWLFPNRRELHVVLQKLP